MFRHCVFGLAVACCAAAPVAAGGGGAVAITGLHGRVRIREIDSHTGQPTGPWRPARTGVLDGTYLLRTDRASWAHINLPFRLRKGSGWRDVPTGCIDRQSVVRIDSYADSVVSVMRGQISEADGKRVGHLPRVMGSG
jgi:hypothetical protein